MAMFVVPSDLRKNSALLKYISGMMDYKPLPGLERLTGADVMISPDGLVFPGNDRLILFHIRKGAKLIQLKFGHDLPSSIIDGRLNEALSRMLATGANTWQCLLLFVGIIGRDETRGMVTINGQLTYGKQPMKWYQVRSALSFWTERKGSFIFPLSGEDLPSEFAMLQDHVNRIARGEDTKLVFPKKLQFYNEVAETNPILNKWAGSQNLVMVNDLRNLICNIPGAKIGPERANVIWQYMAENNIRQDFSGFSYLIESDKILKVSGIGKKVLNNIKLGLYNTLEERNERNKR